MIKRVLILALALAGCEAEQPKREYRSTANVENPNHGKIGPLSRQQKADEDRRDRELAAIVAESKRKDAMRVAAYMKERECKPFDPKDTTPRIQNCYKSIPESPKIDAVPINDWFAKKTKPDAVGKFKIKCAAGPTACDGDGKPLAKPNIRSEPSV